MKVLQVITSLQTGGSEKLIAEMCPHYREDGIHVDILLFDGRPTPLKTELEEKGFHLYSLGNNNNVYRPIHLLQLIPYLRHYDIIHTHNTACQYYVALAKLMTFSRVKLVTTEHNTTNRRRNHLAFHYADRIIYGQYERIIGISEKTTESLSGYLHLEHRLTTISNGINIATFKDAQATSRNLFPSTIGKKLIIMVAAFRPQKDHETVVNALSLLPPDYVVLFVGDGIRRKQIESYAQQVGVGERVLFSGVRNDVPQLLKMADVVVLSSHWEGFGLAAAEGMAAGKPVVASDVPGLAEVVRGGGVLFEPGNARQLAGVLKRLVDDRAYYTTVAQRCTERAENYSIQSTIKGYEYIYQQLVNEYNGNA